MLMFERVSNGFANKLANILLMDKDKKEIVAYGAYAVLDIAWSIAAVMLFGLVFKVFYEALLFSFIVAWLRKFSGGVHASTPNRCAFLGAATAVGLSVMLNNISTGKLTYIYSFLCVLIAFVIVYKFAPVQSENKPIRTKEKRIRMHKQSIRVLFINTAIIILLYTAVFVFGIKIHKLSEIIATALLWQAFTLTSIGGLLITKADLALGYFLKPILGWDSHCKEVKNK